MSPKSKKKRKRKKRKSILSKRIGPKMRGNAAVTNRKFVIVSFFAAITLSSLCQSAFAVFKQHAETENWQNLCYALGLGLFLLKYFVDDVKDDSEKDTTLPSRRILGLLSVAWTCFLLAAFAAEEMMVSAWFWFVGIAIVRLLLWQETRGTSDKRKRGYARQNGILGIIVLVFASSPCWGRLWKSGGDWVWENGPLAIAVVSGVFFLCALSDGKQEKA
jgi:hypothetical protein